MNGQRISKEYLTELMGFFEEHHLCDPPVVYGNEAIFREHLNVGTFKFVNSGTSALFLIMNKLKTEGANTVWGPGLTHISWINCANWLDLAVDYVDVSEKTLSVDPDKLLAKIESTGAPDILVMVDMAGYVGRDTLSVREICDDYGITMIEDAAHAFGQKYAGVYSGTVGHYGFYSFSNPKLLTAGEGGGLICEGKSLNQEFEDSIYQGGWYKNYKESYTKGLNFIMSNWLTELLRYQLRDIDQILKAHHARFIEFKNKGPELFTFPSDNEFYAPSILLYRDNELPEDRKHIKNVGNSPTLWGRYLNMAPKGQCPVSEQLQDSLVYWRL